jgi:G:T/U-mismatch repair DNA glycosylase
MPTEEKHPWNWYVPSGATTVIIGTFPPTRRNWSYDFFYPNKNNYFWRIMAALAGRELQHFSGAKAVEERKAILDQLHTGVSDMGKTIRRRDDNSLDENLQIVEYMDIFRLLDENPSVRKILFTSSSGQSSAVRWFTDYLALHGIRFRLPKGRRPLRYPLEWPGRDIEVVVLYSTSARVGATVSFDTLTELYGQEINTNQHIY